MKEKRDIRKELRLTPSEVAAFQTAADAAGLPLATWIVQAARAYTVDRAEWERLREPENNDPDWWARKLHIKPEK